jgi:hypothetical protein
MRLGLPGSMRGSHDGIAGELHRARCAVQQRRAGGVRGLRLIPRGPAVVVE